MSKITPVVLCQECAVSFKRNPGQTGLFCSDECRFWSKVDKTPGHGPDGDCWVWTVNACEGGYGFFKHSRKTHRAHRWLYEQETGESPECVCHFCDNPPCVRLSHLFGGTKLDNTRDMDRKGRRADISGEKIASTKLTWEKVRKARREYKKGVAGSGSTALAKRYGVCKATMWDLLTGKTWKEK